MWGGPKCPTLSRWWLIIQHKPPRLLLFNLFLSYRYCQYFFKSPIKDHLVIRVFIVTYSFWINMMWRDALSLLITSFRVFLFYWCLELLFCLLLFLRLLILALHTAPLHPSSPSNRNVCHFIPKAWIRTSQPKLCLNIAGAGAVNHFRLIV